MKKLSVLFVIILIVNFSNAQSLISLESIDEINPEASVNQDINQSDNIGNEIHEQLDYLKVNPIDLNQITNEQLSDLFHLNPTQIKSFISYRNTVGNFIDFHELQSLPGWSLTLLKLIRPFVYVSASKNIAELIKSNIENQKSLFLIRYVSSLLKKDSMKNNSIAFKYNYDSKKNISIGLNGENDAGETFAFEKNKKGFDFTSGHLFYKGKGFLKSLIIGDYLINLGQGLIQWQSAGFNRGTSVECIKRQGMAMKPYHSFGEFNFHRGLAFQLVKKNISMMSFISTKRLDAFVNTDTASGQIHSISSFDYSGLHNSASSMQRKFNTHEFIAGSSLQYQKDGSVIGLSFIHYIYSLPIKPSSTLPYNLFAFRGQRMTNLSFHYSQTINNFHFFGELASDLRHLATINGAIFSISEKMEMSFLHRLISKSYHSLYSNAFTAQSKPLNENGIYSSFGMKLNKQIQLNAFLDYCKFPWLRYSVNRPSGCSETGLTMTFVPTKKTKLIIFYSNKKDLNFQPDHVFTIENIGSMKKNYKADLVFTVNKSISLKTRISFTKVENGNNSIEKGVLMFVDFHLKPLLKPFSATLRLFNFETDGYDSRIYAYENDIMYTYSMSSFYGNGKGFYLNLNYKIKKMIRIEAKWAMCLNAENASLSTMYWQKSQLKLQFLAFF